MTLPTKLTFARIVMTFVIMALLFIPSWIAKSLALGCFLLASLTDWLDGYLARRWQQMTPLGALLDPIADKVLVLGTFLAFVQLRLIPAWMVLIILLRELVITGVRLYAASRHLTLAAAKEGKHKTVSQFMTIFVIFIVLILRELPGAPAFSSAIMNTMRWGIVGCLWVTMLLTVFSGTMFFWRHRHVLREAVGR